MFQIKANSICRFDKIKAEKHGYSIWKRKEIPILDFGICSAHIFKSRAYNNWVSSDIRKFIIRTNELIGLKI